MSAAKCVTLGSVFGYQHSSHVYLEHSFLVEKVKDYIMITIIHRFMEYFTRVQIVNAIYIWSVIVIIIIHI
jgi:hypothetical protein